MLFPPPPPVIPISVWAASPGPFTTHPIIDNLMGVLICANFSSSVLTVLMTSNPCLAHDGQDIIVTPRYLKFKDFKISFPIFISCTGSSDRDTLRVSPIPSSNSIPKPMEDFMLPGTKLPDSVIPKCSG